MEQKKISRKEFLKVLGGTGAGVVVGKIAATKPAISFISQLGGIALEGYGASVYQGKEKRKA